jgi:bifunctional non-homologous end joining protein LigD
MPKQATVADDVALRRAGRHTVEISRPDKVLFPESGVTKLDLADHYRAVAPALLPHVRDRPVSMQRFPGGIGEPGFYHKDVPDHFPPWIRRVRIPKKGGSLQQLVIDEAATLIYLADQACITPHVWTSHADRLREPDRVVFDLDPPWEDAEAAFDEVRWAAHTLRDALDALGLASFVMTSGSRGLHLHVPIRRGPDVDRVRAFARDLAELLAGRHSDRLTVETRKEKRGDRIYLDVLRNGYAQTAVAPYAVRPRPGAPVATPIAWHELDERGMGPRRFRIGDLPRRLERAGDPWKGMGRHGRALARPGDALNALVREARRPEPS